MDSVFIIFIIFGGFAIGAGTGFFAAKQWLKKTSAFTGGMTGQQSLPKQDFSKSGYLSLLHLWRKKENNGLVMEIDGVMFPDRSSMSKEAVQRHEKIAHEWLSWLGIADKPDMQSVSLPEQMPVSQMPAQTVQPVKSTVARPSQTDVMKEPEQNLLEPQQKIKTFREQSMAEQIDAILQEKIAESGMESKEIKITEDIHHSVIFHVGPKSFQSLTDLDDPEALKLIRSAVAEWEKRTDNIHRK